MIAGEKSSAMGVGYKECIWEPVHSALLKRGDYRLKIVIRTYRARLAIDCDRQPNFPGPPLPPSV
jgi:hypothetical protein